MPGHPQTISSLFCFASNIKAPAEPSITTTLDTLASITFLANGVVFFNSGMGDLELAPQLLC
jgi:hypothetical protein